MGDFGALLSEFRDRISSLSDVIIHDLEALKEGKYGCKTGSVSARNKLKELIDISQRLKRASLAKSKSLPKRKANKGRPRKETDLVLLERHKDDKYLTAEETDSASNSE